MRISLLIIATLLVFFVGLGCKDAGNGKNNTEPVNPEDEIASVESKIDLIIKSFVESGKTNEYNDVLIEKAKEIEQHGNVAKNLLLKRIGTNPAEDLLLVEAYFQIVGTSSDTLIQAVHCLNTVLSNHAAFRFRCTYEDEYIFGEKYLSVLMDALEDKSTFCCEAHPKGIPVWLFAANEIKKLVDIDFGFDVDSENSITLHKRLDLLHDWLKMSILYYYSKEYEQPTTPKEFRTYHLDIEAMNANIPTKEYRRMSEHKWLSPNNRNGYGSPYYDEQCFENWSMFKSQFSTYTVDAFQLREFEKPRK